MGWIIRASLCALLCASILCVKVYFERGRIINFNPKYVEYAWANVSRNGRRSDYYINVEFISRCVFTNNLTVTLKFYEFRWNAYKSSIVQFRYKLCDFLEKDPYIGAAAAAEGLKCPLLPAKYVMTNLTGRMDDFPSAFPFEKGRLNFLFNVTATEEWIGEAVLYLTFKNEIKGKKRG